MALIYSEKRNWISLWFIVTSLIVFWDAGYCLMRPRSMPGGDLHWIWKPYALYMKVDYVYGLPWFERGDGFTSAQAFMNLIENFMNILYLYKTHSAPSPVAPLIGLVGATMTLSKTALYWVQEYFCNYCAAGHNKPIDLLVLWIIPNGVWLVGPSFIIYALWQDVAEALYAVKGPNRKVKAH